MNATPHPADQGVPALRVQRAYEALRQMVLLGSGAPGGPRRLVERELAAALGMSRTPIREALGRLALAEFIAPASGRGYLVRRFTPRDVCDHFDLRILFESRAAELAAGCCSDQGAPDSATLQGLADSGIEFHTGLARCCGNTALCQVIETLIEHPIGHLSQGGESDLEPVRQEHLEVVRLVAEGRGPAAAAAMTRHLELQRQRIGSCLGDSPHAEASVG